MSEEVADTLRSETLALHSHLRAGSIRSEMALRLIQTALREEDHLPLGTAVAWTLGGAATAAALLAVLAVPSLYNKSSESKGEAKETDALLAEKGALSTGVGSDVDTASCVS